MDSQKDINDIDTEQWLSLDIPKSVQIVKDKESKYYCKFIIEPLHKGFGMTLGTALRRVLLSTLMSHAVYAVKIDGITHEYDTISGIREDVLELLLNLKQVKFQTITADHITVTLRQQGLKIVTAADIDTGEKIEIINPDHIICHMQEEANLDITLFIKRNRGFITAEENKNADLPVGAIFLDSNHSLIERVRFDVQNIRVGHKTDFDKLIFELHTNGGIKTEDAISYASKILKEYFSAFINFDEMKVVEKVKSVPDETQIIQNQYFSKNINDLELSVRSINCLQNAKIDTIGELVKMTEAEILKTKNFGRKSLQEIKTILAGMSLNLGMNIPDDEIEKPVKADATLEDGQIITPEESYEYDADEDDDEDDENDTDLKDLNNEENGD